jgi:hypothetical protein
MPAEIRINDRADGEWVMMRVGSLFNPMLHHCIGLHRNGRVRGGVVFTDYIGAAIMVHMAGDETNWATRDFLWMVYDYAFNQLGVRKLLGTVAASNTRALAIDLRMGFHIETRIKDVLPDGGDLLILTMDRSDARWLKVKPRYYRSLMAVPGGE